MASTVYAQGAVVGGCQVLQQACLAHMVAGKQYTSAQLVRALGRQCGQAQGQPVVNALRKLAAAGTIIGTQQGTHARAPWLWALPAKAPKAPKAPKAS